MSIVLLIVLGIVAVIILAIIAMYNGLIKLKNRVDEAWSDIDVQLKRRYDLIPNLVETVKGYAAHEKETLEKVVQARNATMQAQSGGDAKKQAEAENALSATLKSIFALSDSYPDLKA
ncbi:LemA family protein, partial [Patescibacteria group bacterium]|nr:LemA family protein [Patescibacteria group bacterium]